MLEDGGMEQKGKRTHGHVQQCGDWGGGVVREIHGDEKYTIIDF